MGRADGVVTALPAAGCESATCAPLWSAPTESEITGAPIVTDGTVIAGSDDGTVTAFARS